MTPVLPPPAPGLRACVVVPARDEEARIAACVAALAAQTGVARGAFEVLLVLDGCTDATGAVAERTAASASTGGSWLTLHTTPGPQAGVGAARRCGMDLALARLTAAGAGAGGVIASTDADSTAAPDWLATLLAALADGAAAVGGPIDLDPDEAAALPGEVLERRVAEAARRLERVRRHTPGAEHHQFSGASLAITVGAYVAVGGLPAVPALEDEALERALRAAGLPIAYRAAARVRTSARTESHVPRGLAQVLRSAAWSAASPDQGRATRITSRAAASPPLTIDAGREDRGRVIRAALLAGDAADIVLVLGPGVAAAAGAALVAELHARPELVLARTAEPGGSLQELVARPLLNLHAPDLAVLVAPLARTWAVRRAALEALSLPESGAVDLTVLVDVWRAHGLAAIAELPLPGARLDEDPLDGVAAYELLVALTRRFGGEAGLALSSAYATPTGTRRAVLDEQPPVRP